MVQANAQRIYVGMAKANVVELTHAKRVGRRVLNAALEQTLLVILAAIHAALRLLKEIDRNE